MTKEERKQVLKWVFTPMAPIKKEEFFRGRINQLEKICNAINEDGQHAMLFGERGVGKTSLANIMTESITNLYPIKITCNRTDNFKSLWKQAFRDVQFSTNTVGIGFNAQVKQEIINLESSLDENSSTFSSDIIRLLGRFPDFSFLFIFDEFDNILDKEVRRNFADLIKAFSDNNTNTTIIIVGIADDVEKLIGNHQSLERCLKQIRMPRMSSQEYKEIIEKGLERLEIHIDNNLKNKIVEFSSGFPHYIHLLCKFGCEEVVEEDRADFNENDLQKAIHKGIENTNEQLKSAYRKAVIGLSTTNKWKDVLFSCAESELDEFNCFSITSILNSYNRRTSKTVKGSSLAYNLGQLCYKERGAILERLGTGLNTRYRFSNPMMMAYIKLMTNLER